jgi:hypothetical protein
VGDNFGMLNVNPTTVLAATAGFEVVSIEAAGELQRCPLLGWAVIPSYGYGLGGSIVPVALGIIFNAEVHGIRLPDGRVLAAPEGAMPRFFKDAGTWAAHVNGALAPALGAKQACRMRARFEQ